METNIVYQEDCIKGMKKIPSNSINLVLTDPPYGITACEWDKPIDLKKFWVEIKRIIKPNGAIVMTASQPFTTDLINSNREMFKYELIWEKDRPNSIGNVNKMPLRYHENILVFYNELPIYNKQFIPRSEGGLKRIKSVVQGGFKPNDKNNHKFGLKAITKKYDKMKICGSILEFKKDCPTNLKHSTQKPTSLFQYLIKSYSNENQLILDCFGGSGTTAIACIETNRQYILFENNPLYFKIINDRIQSAKSQTQLSNESCPNGEFNMGLEVQKSEISSPKLSPTEITSPNPNIISNLKKCPPQRFAEVSGSCGV